MMTIVFLAVNARRTMAPSLLQINPVTAAASATVYLALERPTDRSLAAPARPDMLSEMECVNPALLDVILEVAVRGTPPTV
jgi:hypothetical protein